ncbi:MAG: hypothetical protein PWQ60_1858 [Thermoanaerobacteraceae bacterium]|nr:hypothetical protein [Thermoanaerobacteraceae bacterium]
MSEAEAINKTLRLKALRRIYISLGWAGEPHCLSIHL